MIHTIQAASFISESEFAEEVKAADDLANAVDDMTREATNLMETGALVTVEIPKVDLSKLEIPDVNEAEIDDLLAKTEEVRNAHLISFAEEFATATADANAVLAEADAMAAQESAAPVVEQKDPIVAAAEAEMAAALDAKPHDPIDLSDLEPIPEL